MCRREYRPHFLITVLISLHKGHGPITIDLCIAAVRGGYFGLWTLGNIINTNKKYCTKFQPEVCWLLPIGLALVIAK